MNINLGYSPVIEADFPQLMNRQGHHDRKPVLLDADVPSLGVTDGNHSGYEYSSVDRAVIGDMSPTHSNPCYAEAERSRDDLEGAQRRHHDYLRRRGWTTCYICGESL